MYNEKQKDAIFSYEPRVVVIAPPGSGKTHTMIGAIQHFIETTNPKRVVAITFTKKATEELSSRLFAIDDLVHIATIHSWSLNELNRMSREKKFRVKLLEEEQIMSIIKPFIEFRGINEKMKTSCFYYVMGNINPDLRQDIKSKFEAVRSDYIEFKRERHLYDFTDLPLYLKDKLEEYDEFITVDGLFVDEFQDVDPIQLDVFTRVVAAKKFYIGDIDQAIYMFRGASRDIFERLIGFKVYNLNVNYRSYQPIIDYALSFKKQIVEGFSISATVYKKQNDIIAERGDGEGRCKIFVSHYGSFLNELDRSERKSASSFISKEFENTEYQVLCRTNKEARVLKELGFTNAMTIHQAKGLEFENVLVIDFIIANEEDINVAFVALTRAKNNLVVTSLEMLEEWTPYCDVEKIKFMSAGSLMAF